jgi:hypothetical protein
MKKWCLISICERDIENPRFFDTKEEAQEAMCADLASIIKLTVEEVKKIMTTEHCVWDYAEVYEDYAWTDRNMNYDWRIFDVSNFCI